MRKRERQLVPCALLACGLSRFSPRPPLPFPFSYPFLLRGGRGVGPMAGRIMAAAVSRGFLRMARYPVLATRGLRTAAALLGKDRSTEEGRETEPETEILKEKGHDG